MRRDLERRLAELADRDLLRSTLPLASACGPTAVLDGREVVNLASNDYLGLAARRELSTAAAGSLDLGSGAGAARLVTGSLELHEELERALAAFVGAPALLFGSGYLANVGTIPALAPASIVSDELNHASLVDACRLARAGTRIYRHRDVDHLAAILREVPRPALVVTESVFSMDGDEAPLADICDIASGHGAWVYVDEAHAFGHMGPGGRGLAADLPVHVRMGTLGKSLGSYGAFVTGADPLVPFLTSTARTFLYSTALPPAACAASRAALGIVASAEGDRLRGRLLASAGRVREALASQGWELLPGPSPIVPVLVGDAGRAMALASALLDRGVLVRAMRWPTVALGTERLRVVVSASHGDDHIALALDAFESVRSGL